jgi:Fanconi anemia group M protein
MTSGNRHFNVLKGISLCSTALKVHHATELIETQTVESLIQYLNEICRQAEKSKSKGVQQLVKKPEFIQAHESAKKLFLEKKEHPKISIVESIIQKKLAENQKAKIIVFTQFRQTAVSICKNLNQISGVNARVFVGQAKKGDTGMSQKEQQAMIHDFALGIINILCATCIAEEGLDIPEVNQVIFYEPIASEIRKIQRTGRTARLCPGELKILITRNTRDQSNHYISIRKEKKMNEVLKNINEEFNNINKQKSLVEFK